MLHASLLEDEDHAVGLDIEDKVGTIALKRRFARIKRRTRPTRTLPRSSH